MTMTWHETAHVRLRFRVERLRHQSQMSQRCSIGLSLSKALRRPSRAAPRAALGSLHRFVAPLRTSAVALKPPRHQLCRSAFWRRFAMDTQQPAPGLVAAVARRRSRATGAHCVSRSARRPCHTFHEAAALYVSSCV
jgi:hypothetical protein